MGRTLCEPGRRPAHVANGCVGPSVRRAARWWGIVAAALSFIAATPTFAQPANVQPGVVEREYRDNVPPRPPGTVNIPSVDQPSAWQNAQSVRLTLTGVNIEGNTVISDETLMEAFRDLLGKDVSVAQIFAATEEITRRYDQAGYALSLAYVPAQDVRNGVVLIRVIEGYIAAVDFRGDADNSGRWESYGESLMESRPLKSATLERYLLLISDLAGVKATSFFERVESAGAGAMRLVVNVDIKSIGARAEINNRGSKAIGPIRAFVNFELNDVIGLEERFTAFGATTLDGQELVYVGGRFDFPIGSEGTVFSLEAARSETKPGGALLSAIEFQGTGWTGYVGFTHAVIRSIKENLFVSVGMTYKNLKSELSGAMNSHDKMAIATAGFDYDSRAGWGGIWRVAMNLLVGLDILDATQQGDPLSSRAGASGQFVKVEGSISHLASLGELVSIYGEVAGQASSDPLLVSEQCGYGGGQIGRAFDPFEITGDHCVKARAELRFDLPVHRTAIGNVLKTAQFYLLADFGYMVKAGTLLPTEKRAEMAESIGWGWRFRTQDYVSGFIEVAHPLDRGIAASDGERDTRLFFGLAADY